MTSETRLIKVGPAERYSRYSDYFDLKGRSEISQIFVSGGDDGIMSIQFQYVENGEYVLSKLYGTQGSTYKFHTIELNHPAEYITGVNGLYSDKSDNIKVITFTTNIQEYGPFGVTNPYLQSQFSDPRSFSYNLGKSCQFGGFHGSYYSISGLLSIGFYLSAKTLPPSLGSETPKKES
ncbi:unnamed protein product [Microthlaspi erraticum]|uniref:Jacalin-type lectin domain-containing protein n=1 Tax=Microthlaspi erraticum TaxID=1685480 RepID=A0A6D2IMZ2_9BRAS|nr:unnamed protein product [Microthlaspi erraticum]